MSRADARWNEGESGEFQIRRRRAVTGGRRARHVSNVDQRPARDESGSVLILAMVFLVVVSLITLTLANSIGTSLVNVLNFRSARSMQSVANSVTEAALASVRYNFTPTTLNAAPPQPCWVSGSSPSELTLDGQSAAVWCSTRWSPLSDATRVVTLSTCPSSLTAAACAASPLLLAVVTFDDYPPQGAPVASAQCTTTCGVGVTVNSWVYAPAPPTLTSVVTSSGTGCATTPITLTGTGFISGASNVSFSLNATNNVILQAPDVQVLNSTTITACTPAGTASNAQVTVTTPVGTNSLGVSFSYS